MDIELASIIRLANTLPSRTILGPDGNPYLTRFLIKGDFGLDTDAYKTESSIYLHQFHRPDLDRDLHSHPWPWSTSTILHGGYIERRSNEECLEDGDTPYWFCYGVGECNSFAEGDYHTIVEIEPDTWTLFATGPVDRTWYFWNPEVGPVHWKKYLEGRPARVRRKGGE